MSEVVVWISGTLLVVALVLVGILIFSGDLRVGGTGRRDAD